MKNIFIKMSVMYGQMAAKQAAAKIMAQAAAAKNVGNKNKYEYDSDEETEGGKYFLGRYSDRIIISINIVHFYITGIFDCY